MVVQVQQHQEEEEEENDNDNGSSLSGWLLGRVTDDDEVADDDSSDGEELKIIGLATRARTTSVATNKNQNKALFPSWRPEDRFFVRLSFSSSSSAVTVMGKDSYSGSTFIMI
mmetsp:Transcript_19654/g.27801  ORF Transcript_19654/g.27801 Transcript_19654/m.27801 type:complete len:113 (+) Transcript_19654:488-826(+)